MEGEKSKTKLRIEIITIYFVLFCGGLWHIPEGFESVMDSAGGYMIIAIAVYMVIRFWLDNFKDTSFKIIKNEIKVTPFNIIIFSILTIVLTWTLEYIGVTTGMIFGNYEYGPNMTPKFYGVPVAIGFAWLSTFFASAGITINRFKIINPLIIIIIIAIFMTMFDVFMEPASIKLDYWKWEKIFPPLQNYLSWFLISVLLGFFANYFKLFNLKIPGTFTHVYAAQLMYFVMVYFL